jgi:uncharacterized protein (UPF0548 family)
LFLITQPRGEQINELIDRWKDAPFSYQAVGASRSGRYPAGYSVDRKCVRLASGREAFEIAKRAVQSWAMFDLGWVKTFPPSVAVQPGAVVAVIVSHFGFWSVNLSRIVCIDKQEDSYTFAYGTLGEHVESGEEKFTISWDPRDDSVWYDVLAFSRPNHVLAKLGYPLCRMLQKRLARDSMAAMQSRTLQANSAGCHRHP